MTPEQDLYTAVLEQAFIDAEGAITNQRTQQDREQARLFLTAETGEWAKSRDAVMMAAGFVPRRFTLDEALRIGHELAPDRSGRRAAAKRRDAA